MSAQDDMVSHGGCKPCKRPVSATYALLLDVLVGTRPITTGRLNSPAQEELRFQQTEPLKSSSGRQPGRTGLAARQHSQEAAQAEGRVCWDAATVPVHISATWLGMCMDNVVLHIAHWDHIGASM